MTATRGPDSRLQLVIHGAAIATIGLMAAALVLFVPRHEEAPGQVAQATAGTAQSPAGPAVPTAAPAVATTAPAVATAGSTVATAQVTQSTAGTAVATAGATESTASPTQAAPVSTHAAPASALATLPTTLETQASTSPSAMASAPDAVTTTAPATATTAPAPTPAPAIEVIATAPPVRRVAQSITFRTPDPMSVGDPAAELVATASSGRPVTFTAEGSCAITNGRRLVPTGAGTCAVTATQDGDQAWAAAEPVVRSVTISRAAQSIMVDGPSGTTFGSEPFEFAASATSGLPVAVRSFGPCTVDDGRVTTTGAGTCALTFSQSGDDQWAPADPVVRELSIARANQDIHLASLGRHHLGDPPVALAASATSGLPVTIVPGGPCELDPTGKLALIGAGTCTVTVSQPGDGDWAPAAPVVGELRIERTPQTIAFEVPDTAAFGDPAIELDATATSGLPVAISADGPCRVKDGRVTATGSGTCTLTARQDGDDQWAVAIPVTRAIAVARAGQSIAFAPLAQTLITDEPRPLEATATSGLAVHYRADGPCEILDGAVRPTGAGLCAVTAAQPGDLRFAAAEEVQRVFRIARVPQTIDFMAPPSATLGDPPIELSATASSGLSVTYAARGACSVEDTARLVLDNAGRCTVIAIQAGDDTWAPADDVTRALSIRAPRGQVAVGQREPGAPAEPSPEATPAAALAIEDWPVPCVTWRIIDKSDLATGAAQGAECLDQLPEISRYRIFLFPDASQVARRFTEEATAARPALGVSDAACQPGQPGARAWAHGWLACWLPEGASHAELHWTDEQAAIYGVLESADERFTQLYQRWEQSQGSAHAETRAD